MKTSIMIVAALALATSLAACESGMTREAADRSDNRQIYVSGQNSGDRTVNVPQDRYAGDRQAPNALRGDRAANDAWNNQGRTGTNGN